MKKHILYLPLLFALYIFQNTQAQSQQEDISSFNCFSILVGKKATVDNSVYFAHNEDDYGKQIVNMYRIPKLKHTSDETIALKNTGQAKQVAISNSYLWLEMPGMDFSDSYFNEYGVTIASDQCSSKEKDPEITDGGIGYFLRKIMAEQASTAKEAVIIGGKLIEQFGYSSSGRTYCIADANEAWMLSAVYGKHWVAQRIPNDNIAIIPNYYTITTINLSDTTNYLGSKDIIDYAIKKEWYNPNTDGEFNFRKAYSDSATLSSKSNIARHWGAINLLSEKKYKFDDELPFSFKATKKVSLKKLFSVLRYHYEGTEFDKTNNYTTGNPHQLEVMSICSNTNQYGFVAQLNNNVTKTNTLWLAPRRPCTQPFYPWDYNIKTIPKGYAIYDYKTAIKNHFNVNDSIYQYNDKLYYWKNANIAKQIDANYGNSIKIRKQYIEHIEDSLLMYHEQNY